MREKLHHTSCELESAVMGFFFLLMDDLLLLDLSFNRFLSFELCETFFSGLCDRWGVLFLF